MILAGLFAGIGGFEEAFGAAGHRAVLLAETDPAARAVLADRFRDVELHGDVRELESLPADVELVTAGFPCQNLSMAGDKAGLVAAKSGVVDELFRLIAQAATPPTVVIENVYFMLHLKRGQAMQALAARFEALNYRWAYRVVDTAAFGLPQRRRRVYFVASRTLNPAEVLFADETDSVATAAVSLDRPIGFYWTEGRSGVGLTVDGIPPLKGGSGLGIASAPAVLFNDRRVLTPGVTACERLQGFPVGWTDAAIGHSRRPQARLLGNAVSVPAARWVANRIVAPAAMLDLEVGDMPVDSGWPNAACNIDGRRRQVLASNCPLRLKAPSIADFLDDSWTHLSNRALGGFLRRAREGGLHFPEGFLDVLDSELRRTGAHMREAA